MSAGVESAMGTEEFLLRLSASCSGKGKLGNRGDIFRELIEAKDGQDWNVLHR